MVGNNATFASPSSFAAKIEGQPNTAIPETFKTDVLQGVFASEADKDAFMQAVTTHGVTFLRCANSPLSRPTICELSTLEKMARVVSNLWARPTATGEKQ